MPIQEILMFVGLAILALGLLIYIIVRVCKNGWTKDLIDVVDKACAEAEEQWPVGHGEEKKQYVIEAVKAKCVELHIPYQLLVKVIAELIDRAVKSYNVIKK